MSASHSEPMGARGWEPDFRSKAELKAQLEKEARSIYNATWNAWRQGRPTPKETSEELDRLEKQIAEFSKEL